MRWAVFLVGLLVVGPASAVAAPQEVGYTMIYVVNRTEFEPQVYAVCGAQLELLVRVEPRQSNLVPAILFFRAPHSKFCGWGEIRIQAGNTVYRWARTRTASTRPGTLVFCLTEGNANLKAYIELDYVPLDCPAS